MITRIAIATATAMLGFGMTACGFTDASPAEPVTTVNMDDPESVKALHRFISDQCVKEGQELDAYVSCRDKLFEEVSISMTGTILSVTPLPDEYQVIVVGNDVTRGEVFVCPDMVDGCTDVAIDDTVSMTAEYTMLRPDDAMSVVVTTIK